jgi:hypothetical protein
MRVIAPAVNLGHMPSEQPRRRRADTTTAGASMSSPKRVGRFGTRDHAEERTWIQMLPNSRYVSEASKRSNGKCHPSEPLLICLLSDVGRAEGALLELAQIHLVGLHGGEVLHHPAAGGVERLRRDDDVTGDQLLRLDERPVEHTDAVP